MPEQQFDAIAQKLADLADRPETSFVLRAYLKAVADRDIVDVINEIEVLARIVAEHAPEKREL
ncbi:hypothetical protein [uncultured Tateyamaria sp.]|uniref:hypothetical protein n=1 Tax=uncultured Tateyamaria sp. TaxID=455651 RepID=UPI002615BD6A|nr:hypothetical protein [uncultured Tateyamaria sp.]